MIKSNNVKSDNITNKVLKMHDEELKNLEKSLKNDSELMNESILISEQILSKLGFKTSNDERNGRDLITEQRSHINLESWQEIANRAIEKYPNIVSIEDLFSEDELKNNHMYLLMLQEQFKEINKLDEWDFAVSGIVGTIAALIDFFIVTKVDVTSGEVKPGALKSGVEELWDKLLPPEKVSLLESKYKVPFDISVNTSKISQDVFGLNPKHHRMQSLGHDPLLGFIFGVKDLMRGQLTAIDGRGRRIVKNVSGVQGKTFINSVISEFGHLLSDLNSSSPSGKKLSIPAPLTPLLQIIQEGNINYNGRNYTVGDLVKRMYYDGYNFNHFLGMSIPVVIISILINLYTALREIFQEDYNRTKHKTDILLFISNSILCAENVGKLLVTNNPFSINYISWINTAKYTIRALKYVLVEYHIEEINYIQKIIDNEFSDTLKTIENTWEKFSDTQDLHICIEY